MTKLLCLINPVFARTSTLPNLLTHSHTMTPFDGSGKEAKKLFENVEKLLVQAISPFPTMFSTP